MKESFHNKLIEYCDNGRYPLHMPGHKRNDYLFNNVDPYHYDITEIDGFDNLHCASGILKDAMDNAAKFFGTDRTWFLVNGSSCGILAAINAVTNIGDHIIIGRNCHKAVYNGIKIRNLQVDYLYPSYIEEYGVNGGYSWIELEDILKRHNDIKAVLITSPTYEGIVSNIEKLANVCHKYGAVLIVDEAHGAHLGLCDKLPIPAYKLGADIVIESTHKTLPAMTQTGLLHMCGNIVDEEKMNDMLSVYQTSSPSYVLMASIDKCISEIRDNCQQRYEELINVINKIREKVNKCSYLFIPCEELYNEEFVYDIDVTKLVIGIKNNICTGKVLAEILRNNFNFEVEMESLNYVLAITTISDKIEELERLAEALVGIDSKLYKLMENDELEYLKEYSEAEELECSKEYGNVDTLEYSEKISDVDNIEKEEFSNISKKLGNRLFRNEKKFSIYEADLRDKEYIKLEHACGRIAGAMVYLYPPGIPILVPGEVISEDLVSQIDGFIRANLNVVGLDGDFIKVIKK